MLSIEMLTLKNLVRVVRRGNIPRRSAESLLSRRSGSESTKSFQCLAKYLQVRASTSSVSKSTCWGSSWAMISLNGELEGSYGEMSEREPEKARTICKHFATKGCKALKGT